MNWSWYEAARCSFWLILNELLIENERKLVWGSPEQILIDFNQILCEDEKKLVWGGPAQILMGFLIKFQLKTYAGIQWQIWIQFKLTSDRNPKGSEAAQSRFWSIFRVLVWGSPEQILIDSKLNQHWKRIDLR